MVPAAQDFGHRPNVQTLKSPSISPWYPWNTPRLPCRETPRSSPQHGWLHSCLAHLRQRSTLQFSSWTFGQNGGKCLHRTQFSECESQRLTGLGHVSVLSTPSPLSFDLESQNFPAMDVSVDCALFGFDGESLKLLLIRQRTESAGELTEAALQMALPGNLVDEDESLDAAAKRVLSELTQLEDVFLKQFHALATRRVSDLKDQQWLRVREEPQNRVMTVAYYGLVSCTTTPLSRFVCRRRHWTDVQRLPTWPLTTTTSRRWPCHPAYGVGIQAHFI